jgi:hypothetical protein
VNFRIERKKEREGSSLSSKLLADKLMFKSFPAILNMFQKTGSNSSTTFLWERI